MSTLQAEVQLGQNVSVFGSHNSVTTVGGDLVMAETFVQKVEGKEDFFRHSLESISLTAVPEGLPELAAMLTRQSLLVLGGTYEDKPTVARQVGRRLAQADPAAVRPLLEWNRSSDFFGLLQALRKEAHPAVVLLTGILPQQVGYDLNRLREAALAGGHLVLATTDLTRAAWKLAPTEQGLWKELHPEGLFSESVLVSVLVERLDEVSHVLPPSTVEEAPDPGLARLGGMTFREIAGRLRTPPTVSVFVQQLVARAARGALDPAAVMDLIGGATSEGERVEKWFHTVLSADEQLLAISLSFFDGLADDQLFAALEHWVAHIREHRDPRLRPFDYADLDTLQAFFAPVESDSAGLRFESRWPGLRQSIFRAAWRSHRRQLMSARPVLTVLAAESVGGRSDDLELYGSWDRRYQIRRAVAATLTDLGLLSVAAVEPALLQLASDSDVEVQAVAAEAVARWRLYDADEQLFTLLERWQQDARIRAAVEALLAGRDEKENRGPLVHVRATIALALGHAAQFDAPNQLTPKLVALFEQLGDDSNKFVRKRFAEFTLPRVVALHLDQLRGRLRYMARHVALTHPIGASLAHAYRTGPAEVAATLDAWHHECERDRPETFHPGRITHRDALLMVLAFTYGELEYDGDGPLTAEVGFERLKLLLSKERHPKVRTAVVIAITRQAQRRFERVAPELQKLVEEVTPDEREEIVRILTQVYLDQRAELKDGPDEIEVNERRYPVWLDTARPLTAVEVVLLRWMKTPEFPAAQRIAFQASISFARALDEELERQITRMLDARRQRAENDAAALVPCEPAPMAAASGDAGWYTGIFVPWLATLSAPGTREAVRSLIPEALVQNTAHPGSLEFVLGRWEKIEGDRGTADLAARLRGAIGWHGTAWLLLAGGGIFLFVILIVIF
jgi:hypothetical protein